MINLVVEIVFLYLRALIVSNTVTVVPSAVCSSVFRHT
jgi:hypothetical protein